MRNKPAINPITLRTPSGANLVISRLGYGFGQVQARMQFMLMPAGTDAENAMHKVSFIDIEEAKFIEGIGHLFPRGELACTHLEDDKPQADKDSLAAILTEAFTADLIQHKDEPAGPFSETGNESVPSQRAMIPSFSVATCRITFKVLGEEEQRWKPTLQQVKEIRDRLAALGPAGEGCEVDYKEQYGGAHILVTAATASELTLRLPSIAELVMRVCQATPRT